MVTGLRVPVSPWWDGGLQQVSHVSLADREAPRRDDRSSRRSGGSSTCGHGGPRCRPSRSPGPSRRRARCGRRRLSPRRRPGRRRGRGARRRSSSRRSSSWSPSDLERGVRVADERVDEGLSRTSVVPVARRLARCRVVVVARSALAHRSGERARLLVEGDEELSDRGPQLGDGVLGRDGVVDRGRVEDPGALSERTDSPSRRPWCPRRAVVDATMPEGGCVPRRAPSDGRPRCRSPRLPLPASAGRS